MGWKISRNSKVSQNVRSIDFQRRNRILVGPAMVLLLAYILMFRCVGSAHAQSVVLAWDPNTDSVTSGYKVYRSEQSGSFGTPSLNSSLLTTTSFTDSSVQPGHSYFYVVTAVSTTGLESGGGGHSCSGHE
jgi:fibronectin type III domain protein